MNRRAWIAGAIAVAIAAAGSIALVRQPDDTIEPRPPAERPALALLTSLPLIFGERFGLDSGGSPALTRIEQRYHVQPIGVADAASLSGRRLLLMAHPRAQPAMALVELDEWVRGGGRVLLLADPQLSWPSERPLGDRLRPPPAFADTGLLGHWGLTLAARGDGTGTLSGKDCEILGDGLVARCRIGKGAATVIADADLLNAEPGGPSGEPTMAGIELVLSELARFERP